jgi:hypothetical protein
VFSPADAQVEIPSSAKTVSLTLLDGVDALSSVLRHAGYESVIAAVAAHTVFLHPETVGQTGGKPLFRIVRNAARRGEIDTVPGVGSVMFDDNQGPGRAFLWSAQRTRGPDIQFNHIWGDPRNADTYTALWNLCATPAFLAKTTDGSNHPEVLNLLRYRSLDLYGHLPHAETEPERPAGYEALLWLESPSPVADLEILFRQRLADAPLSRPALSARQIGWLFSDYKPDSAV